MDTQLSHRHHYIPQYLISNFCDTDGKLWVYDKHNNRILKHKQSPKSIFFGIDRNTFEVNGRPDDSIERIYSDIDDRISKVLDKILANEHMLGNELTWLIYLAAQLKWRVPHQDNEHLHHTSEKCIKEFGLNLRPKDPGISIDSEIVERLEKMDITKQIKRILLSLQPLLTEGSLDEIHRNSYILTGNPNPALIGDNPLIESSNLGYRTLGDFILPLSSEHTLICKNGGRKEHPLTKYFYYQKDLSILHLADRYVGCRDFDYLDKTVQIYNEILTKGAEDGLLRHIFKMLP